MAEYIDREALKNDGHLCWHDGKGNVFYEVDHAPASDVVEVVRCKDCKYITSVECIITGAKTWFCEFGRWPQPVEADHYCAYGERKDGAE